MTWERQNGAFDLMKKCLIRLGIFYLYLICAYWATKAAITYQYPLINCLATIANLMDSSESLPKINEICMVALGDHQRRPLLVARTNDQELLIYETFPFFDKQLEADQLKMRFKKLHHGLILRERKSK